MAITTISNPTAASRYKMAIQLDSSTTTTATAVPSSSKASQPLPPLPPPSNHQAKYSDVPIRLNVDYSRPRAQQSKYQYLPIQLDTKPLPAPRSSPPRTRTQGHVRAIQQHLYPLAAVSPPLPPPLPKPAGSMVRKKVPPRLPAPERSMEDAIAPAPRPYADTARGEDVPSMAQQQEAYAMNSTIRREEDTRRPVVRQEVYAVPASKRREDVTPRLPPAQHEVFLTPTLTRKNENAPKPPIRPDLYAMTPAIAREGDVPPWPAPTQESSPMLSLPPMDRREDEQPLKRTPRQPMYTVMPPMIRKEASQQHLVALPAASRSREEIARAPTRKDMYALDHRPYNAATATLSAAQWPPTRTRTPKPVPLPVVVTAPVAVPAITTPYRAISPAPSPMIKDEPLPPLPVAAITVTAPPPPPPSSTQSHHRTHSRASPSPPPSRGAKLSPRTPGSARRNNKPPPMTAKLHAMPTRNSGLFDHLSNNLLMESSLDWDQKRVLSMSKATYLASCPSPASPKGYSPITALPPTPAGASVPRSVPATPIHLFPPVSPSSIYTDDNRESQSPKSPTPLPLFAKGGPPSPYHLRPPGHAHAHSHSSQAHAPSTPYHPPPPPLSPATTSLTTSAAIFRLDFHLSRPTVLLLKRVISPAYPYEPLARPVWELPAGPVDDADYCISDAVARCVDRLVGLRVIRISGLLACSTGPVPRGHGNEEEEEDDDDDDDDDDDATAHGRPQQQQQQQPSSSSSSSSSSPRRDHRRVGVILDPLASSMPPPPTRPPTQPLPEPPASASARSRHHHHQHPPPPPPPPPHPYHQQQQHYLAPPSPERIVAHSPTTTNTAAVTTAAKRHQQLQLHWTVLVKSIEDVAVRGAEHEEYVWASWNVLQILNMDDEARVLAREALEWAGRCSF